MNFGCCSIDPALELTILQKFGHPARLSPEAVELNSQKWRLVQRSLLHDSNATRCAYLRTYSLVTLRIRLRRADRTSETTLASDKRIQSRNTLYTIEDRHLAGSRLELHPELLWNYDKQLKAYV